MAGVGTGPQAGDHRVSEGCQCLLEALGGEGLVFRQRNGEVIVGLYLPVQPVPDDDGVLAVLMAQVQDLRAEPSAPSGSVLAGTFQPDGKRQFVHAEPLAALAEVRPW